MTKRFAAMLAILIGLILCGSAAQATPEEFHQYLEKMITPGEESSYTIISLKYGTMKPVDSYSPKPFVDIMQAAMLHPVDSSEATNGEYIALAFPEDEIRFDFLFAFPEKNYIRQVNPDGSTELFTAELPEDVFLSVSAMLEMEADALHQYSSYQRQLEQNIPEDGWVLDGLNGRMWIDDRAVLSIDLSTLNNYVVKIIWGQTTSLARIWDFNCEYDDEKQILTAYYVVCYTNQFDEHGKSSTIYLYEEPSAAVFFLNDDGEVEIDNTDNTPLEDKTFEPLPMPASDDD